jgi:hypothetical protein
MSNSLKDLIDEVVKEELNKTLKEFFPVAVGAATAAASSRRRQRSQPARSPSSYEYKEPVRGDYITTAANATGGRLQGGKEITAAIEPVVDAFIKKLGWFGKRKLKNMDSKEIIRQFATTMGFDYKKVGAPWAQKAATAIKQNDNKRGTPFDWMMGFEGGELTKAVVWMLLRSKIGV